jgi:hypothetical protein
VPTSSAKLNICSGVYAADSKGDAAAAAAGSSAGAGSASSSAGTSAGGPSLQWLIQHVLFPSLRVNFTPPKHLAQDGSITQVRVLFVCCAVLSCSPSCRFVLVRLPCSSLSFRCACLPVRVCCCSPLCLLLAALSAHCGDCCLQIGCTENLYKIFERC